MGYPALTAVNNSLFSSLFPISYDGIDLIMRTGCFRLKPYPQSPTFLLTPFTPTEAVTVNVYAKTAEPGDWNVRRRDLG